MKTLVPICCLLALFGAATIAPADTYHLDPVKGTADGDGSAGRPWKTLQDFVDAREVKGLKGGDTLKLYGGHHGAVKLAGEFEKTVVIEAAPGARATLSRLTVTSGKNWTIRGLVISPSLGKEAYTGSIVTLAEGGPGESTAIVLEDCFVFAATDTAAWGVKEWLGANSGINSGRHGRGVVVRNNYVLNTRFGITLAGLDAVCEGNVISDFSADGIRTTRDGQIVRHNIIKNVYVSDADGDKNHDDGIQAFLFNKGTGEVKNVQVVGNIIINREDAKQKWPATMQGIGFFDGPLVGFSVTDNVVLVDHWHGLSLYDAQGCTIARNTVQTMTPSKMKAWIMLGTKQKLAKDNVVKENFAPTFNLKQPGTVSEVNKPVSEAIYGEALRKAYGVIVEKYGEKHGTAERVRLVVGAEK